MHDIKSLPVDTKVFDHAIQRLTELTEADNKAMAWFANPDNLKDETLVQRLQERHANILKEIGTHCETLAKSHFTWDWKEDGTKGLKPAAYLNCPRGCPDHEPVTVKHPNWGEMHAYQPFEAGSELASLAEWVLETGNSQFPKPPFRFGNGDVQDLDRFLYQLRVEATAGVNGVKAKSGVLLAELKALRDLVEGSGRLVA